jgi:hypothetical protein
MSAAAMIARLPAPIMWNKDRRVSAGFVEKCDGIIDTNRVETRRRSALSGVG